MSLEYSRENYLFKFDIVMTRDQTTYERHDYTLLQFLGDVSALKDALFSVCLFVLYSLFQLGLL